MGIDARHVLFAVKDGGILTSFDHDTLFNEEEPRVWPAQPVRFGCTCGAEKVVAAMAQYSAKDIAHMTTEDGKVTADCQFCGAHYEFDPKTLGFEAEA